MRTGFAIALAWPETKCKQAGAWYDGLMEYLGVSQNKYYKVGHAALILVNSENGQCNYFDFGRYHAPFGQGRVRDAITDHELSINTKASCSSEKVENFEEIIQEILQNKACHGTGYITASYISINFDKAYSKAKYLQESSPLAYGPFVLRGTNCSRFVKTVILAGKPKLYNYFKLAMPYSLSPTPKANVLSLQHQITSNQQIDLSYV